MGKVVIYLIRGKLGFDEGVKDICGLGSSRVYYYIFGVVGRVYIG